jgi:DNA-binding LacI/PurR family transcriptional regulator
MQTKGKATSLDIAHLAGVSQPTVSRALRGSPLVSEQTRRKVQRIAQELNYQVDKNASNLRCQTSGTLALLFFEDPSLDDSLINPFFVAMLGSITRACGQRGFDLLISFQQLSKDWHAEYEDSKKADGLILLGYGDYLEYQARLLQLVAHDTRFVRWGPVLPGQPGVSIGSDNRQGGRDITAHLLQQGRRRIAFLGNASDHYPEFFDRYRGYVDALADAGLAADPALLVDVRLSNEQAGHQSVADLLERGIAFDALFAASDLIAIGAMRELQARNIAVPGQVAVAGFDDIPLAGLANPSLSTVQQDTTLAGTVLVDSLLDLIGNRPVSSRMIPTRLALRGSTATVAATRSRGG